VVKKQNFVNIPLRKEEKKLKKMEQDTEFFAFFNIDKYDEKSAKIFS
jgi:hypothetical protein